MNTGGRREVLGMPVGASVAEPFRTDFLRGSVRRRLSGVKLVISDAHQSIKAAAARVLSATWQRRRVDTQRNALARAGKGSRPVVFAFVATAFAQPGHAAASKRWRLVADQMRPKLPELAALMDDAEEDVLAQMTFPDHHRATLHGTISVERLNPGIERRTDVVGIFPNEVSITRLVGAILMERTEEWAIRRSRYRTLEPSPSATMMSPSACLPHSRTDQPCHAGHRETRNDLHHPRGRDPVRPARAPRSDPGA